MLSHVLYLIDSLLKNYLRCRCGVKTKLKMLFIMFFSAEPVFPITLKNQLYSLFLSLKQ